MYAALSRAVLDPSDRERAAAQVEKLRRRHPRATREELASRIVRAAALQCGAAGLAWSAPAAYFGSTPMGPDLGYQVLAINRMILALSTVYRADSSGTGRLAGLATGLTAGFAADLLRRGIVTALSRTLPRRPAFRAVAGGLAGAALAYGTTIAVGNLARDLFGGRGALLGRRRRR